MVYLDDSFTAMVTDSNKVYTVLFFLHRPLLAVKKERTPPLRKVKMCKHAMLSYRQQLSRLLDQQFGIPCYWTFGTIRDL